MCSGNGVLDDATFMFDVQRKPEIGGNDNKRATLLRGKKKKEKEKKDSIILSLERGLGAV